MSTPEEFNFSRTAEASLIGGGVALIGLAGIEAAQAQTAPSPGVTGDIVGLDYSADCDNFSIGLEPEPTDIDQATILIDQQSDGSVDQTFVLQRGTLDQVFVGSTGNGLFSITADGLAGQIDVDYNPCDVDITTTTTSTTTSTTLQPTTTTTEATTTTTEQATTTTVNAPTTTEQAVAGTTETVAVPEDVLPRTGSTEGIEAAVGGGLLLAGAALLAAAKRRRARA